MQSKPSTSIPTKDTSQKPVLVAPPLRGAWLNTGLEDLNDLLTRDKKKKRGIGLPTKGGLSSSITVLKGPAGAGKSMLSAIISKHIHAKYVQFENKCYLPVSLYFSYTQNAEGLYGYLDQILMKPAAGEHPPLPFILSPKHPFGITEMGGISALRRSLVETLSPFRELPFKPYPNSVVSTVGGTVSNGNPVRKFLESDLWNAIRSNTESQLIKLDRLLAIPDVVCVPFVVIDPINFFFDYRDSRSAVAELFATFRVLRWPLLVTLEDVGAASRSEHRQLGSYVEFEADTVIELMVRSEPHIRRTIEVKKSRNSQPRFGQQMYRIEKPEHGFSNIFSGKHPGFMIFPSIHWVLSHSYQRSISKWGWKTGISTFDAILSNNAAVAGAELAKSQTRHLLPEDAFVIVRGEKGGHKLPISFNLLVAGLWDKPSTDNRNNVLLLSLGEEMSSSIPGIALSESSHSGTDGNTDNNSKMIAFPDEPEPILPGQGKEQFKVMLYQWQARLLVGEKTDISEGSKPINHSLIEATFKPGYLAPDEFLAIVETLLARYRPSRILVENTSHLKMRFPDLHAESMLFPALGCIARSKRMMLIVTDVLGRGHDQQLSYGLASGADFVVDVETIAKGEHLKSEFAAIRNEIEDQMSNDEKESFITSWSKMSISSVRAKNYRRVRLATTVFRPKGKTNPQIFMADVTKALTVSKLAGKAGPPFARKTN